MKKKLIIIVIILILVGGGGAGYYFFFMKKDPAKNKTSPQATPSEVVSAAKPTNNIKPAENVDYYVIERKINVYNLDNPHSIVVDKLYKGEKVSVLEKKGSWFRISPYIVLNTDNTKTAEWVLKTDVSNDKPVIKKQEELEILDGYIRKSDDLNLYRDTFRKITLKLLDDGRCEPEDFAEMGGWVRSVRYKDKRIYFTYCGGMDHQNKIYLDANAGKILP